jgi:glucose-6-phosphate dehydrogenase assembly protein OpcA
MAFNLSKKMDHKEVKSEEKKADSTSPPKPAISKSKACLFNLIVYAQDSHHIENFNEIINMIMKQLPCRIIFIQADVSTSTNSYLKVKTVSEPLKDNKNVSFDKILIEAGGNELDKVSFIVLPYLIPDIPIYLLWGRDPLHEKTILPKLKHYATRLIFDSECTDNLRDLSQALLEQMNGLGIQILDLNWARTGGWREVIAKTFDSEERFNQLKNANTVKIKYNNISSPTFFHPETQAIYLQAWLASRLGWTFNKTEKNHETLSIYYQGSQPVKMELIPEKREDFPSEDLLEIEVSDQNDYVCTITRKSENHVVVHSSNQVQCQIPFSLLLPTLKGRTFIQDVFYHRISSHYAPMLQLISLAQWSCNE